MWSCGSHNVHLCFVTTTLTLCYDGWSRPGPRYEFSATRLFRRIEPFPSSGISLSIISELFCQMGVQISGRCLTLLAYRMESSESWSPGGRPRNIGICPATYRGVWLPTMDHLKHSRTRIHFLLCLYLINIASSKGFWHWWRSSLVPIIIDLWIQAFTFSPHESPVV